MIGSSTDEVPQATDIEVHTALLNAMRAFVSAQTTAAVAPFLAEWPRVLTYAHREPRILPVLKWISDLRACTTQQTQMLTGLLVEAAPSLEWQQTYNADDFGADFLARYGWCEIVGQRGVFRSSEIAAGFLMLGPHLEYPLHAHDAEEIYLPLSGSAEWAINPQDWNSRKPGELIHHPSRIPHAMRTGVEPLLALYIWRSGNLTQKSDIIVEDV